MVYPSVTAQKHKLTYIWEEKSREPKGHPMQLPNYLKSKNKKKCMHNDIAFTNKATLSAKPKHVTLY